AACDHFTLEHDQVFDGGLEIAARRPLSAVPDSKARSRGIVGGSELSPGDQLSLELDQGMHCVIHPGAECAPSVAIPTRNVRQRNCAGRSERPACNQIPSIGCKHPYCPIQPITEGVPRFAIPRGDVLRDCLARDREVAAGYEPSIPAVQRQQAATEWTIDSMTIRRSAELGRPRCP